MISNNKIAKFELYILSLWLLFLLIIPLTVNTNLFIEKKTQTMENSQIKNSNIIAKEFIGIKQTAKINTIPLISLGLFLLGFIFHWRFKHKLCGSTELPLKITKISNINYEHLTFLATYIVPLICFDLSNPRFLIVFTCLLIIIGIIYVKTNMFFANPSLALLGYHIYKINANTRYGEKEDIILIARQKVNLNDSIKYIKLDNNIYYGSDK